MTTGRSTKAQRERTFITLLDEKLETIRLGFCDELRYDNYGTDGGLRQRTVAWRIGGQEFLFTYTEWRETPGTAAYRIRTQPVQPSGKIGDWEELQTLGDMDGQLRKAKKDRGKSAAELKSERMSHMHEGATPSGLILVGLSGSRAYGLSHDGFIDPETGEPVPPSDTDTRGVFVLPTEEILSLGKSKELVEQVSTDTKYDEVERFLSLCMKCNPERLEMLATSRKNGYVYCPVDVSEVMQNPTKSSPWMADISFGNLVPGPGQPKSLASPEGKVIIENQDIFLSKQVVKTYGGYAKEQLYRIEKKKDRSTKPAMHLIRLMLTGIGILENGRVDCDMSDHRESLLAIRKGDMPLEDVFKWHQELEVRFGRLANETKLPDKPDWRMANEILLFIRRRHLPDGQ